ncbi:MAG: DUF4097 family beta strand repeat-containing protein [Clostridium sp.]
MKKLISTKMKVFMVFLLITSITCFTSSMVVLYNSNFKLSDYIDWNNWYFGWNSNHYDSNYYNKNILDMPLADIQSLNLDFSKVSNVNFEVYSGSNLIISSYNNVDNSLNVTNSEGTIAISPSTNINDILVKLPLSYANNLDLKFINGTTNISDITLSSLKIEAINSDININNVKCPSANILTSNGDIKLNNLFSTELSATSSNGEIYSTNLEGSISLKTTFGDIVAGVTNKATNVNINSTNGEVDLQLSQDTNCTIDYNTITGNLDKSSEISRRSSTTVTKNNGSSIIVIGSGIVPISVTTVDGDLEF